MSQVTTIHYDGCKKEERLRANRNPFAAGVKHLKGCPDCSRWPTLNFWSLKITDKPKRKINE